MTLEFETENMYAREHVKLFLIKTFPFFSLQEVSSLLLFLSTVGLKVCFDFQMDFLD